MEYATKQIEILRIEEYRNSPYIAPHRVYYKENGVEKSWDIIDVHDSVSVLIFNKDKESFVIVKQMRPALFLKENITDAYELCAGIIDKEKTLEEIASEEVFEECGYKVQAKDLEKISSFCSSVGFAATKQHLYYVQVDDSMKTGKGGGIDTENIEVVEIPLSEAQNFMYNESYAKTSGLLFAFAWFLQHKRNA